MRINDLFSYFWVYWTKQTVLTTTENDIKAVLADAQTMISDSFDVAQNAYQAALPSLQAALKNQAGDCRSTSQVILTETDSEWTEQLRIVPDTGDASIFSELIVQVTLPNTGAAEGYIGIMANTDTLASKTTLSSMPHYMTVYGRATATPYLISQTQVVDTGVFHPATAKIVIPLYGVRIPPQGIAVYTWNNGTAGFDFNAVTLTYRHTADYANLAVP